MHPASGVGTFIWTPHVGATVCSAGLVAGRLIQLWAARITSCSSPTYITEFSVLKAKLFFFSRHLCVMLVVLSAESYQCACVCLSVSW